MTDESPFALVYGTNAVFPTEGRLPTITTLVAKDMEENGIQLTRNFDFLKDVRECRKIRKAANQHKARALYNEKVKVR